MMMRLLSLLFWLCAAGVAMAAGPQAEVRSVLNHDGLHPGQQAVLAVVVEIPAGFHSQSHTPSSKDYIAFEVKTSSSEKLDYLRPIYPEGRTVEYPQLGALNVYDGRIVVYVPLTVKADVSPGPVTLQGEVQLQLCDDRSCYAPVTLPFASDGRIVSVDQPIAAANETLFAEFDPRVFVTGGEPIAPLPAAAELQFFSWRLKLDRGAYGLAFTIAFVVGIIFNLMPCVLPVVPLKAIGFYEASQHHRMRCFLLGVVFSLGMLTVFGILAGLVIVQKHAWGELFAQDWFVWTIVAVLVLMALGQLGLFSVVLPSGVYRYVPTHTSWSGNFLFGGFTAILSTPCTAPMFVGLLLWAAGQPTWVGIGAVMTVGAGMASPYLVLAAFPQLARRLPRTGAWSELLKQFMAVLLLAVAAWFAAGRLIEGNGYLWIVFGIVAAGSLLLVLRSWHLARTVRAVGIASLIGIMLSGATLYFAVKLTGTLIDWEPYSQSRLESALAERRVVMVEFTANWCANCKELESRVFTDERAAKVIDELEVVTIRADLTSRTADGWEMLQTINPSGGIPLTVIYSPTLDQPIQLSSIYTTENLISALKEASGVSN